MIRLGFKVGIVTTRIGLHEKRVVHNRYHRSQKI